MTEEKINELNEVLEDFSARLNDIIDFSEDDDMSDLVISILHEKANDLILELYRILEMSEFLDSIGK